MSEFETAVFGLEASAANELAMQLSGPSGELEAVATRGNPQGIMAGQNFVAVVCHPHPQHGGTMNNKVVTTMVRSYRDLGVPVVRFNFRGVGKSEGQFDEARGEVEDALAIVAWVREQSADCQLLLAGFSFGSAVAATASYRIENLAHLSLVAPPVERYSYDQDQAFPCPLCVIQGGEDELVDVPGVYAWAETIKSPTTLLRFDEATHFFHGALVQVKKSFIAHLEQTFARV